MLAIPRPGTRGDCGQEARPCPWVGCRHHLLLEVAESPRAAPPGKQRAGKPRDIRPTSLRLNRRRSRATLGRRSGLASSAAALLVQTWIDDAWEHVAGMVATCSLDVADEHPGGLPHGSVAELLGVTDKAISNELQGAMESWRAALPCDECDAAGGEPCRGLGGERLHRRRGRDEIGALLRELAG